MYSITEGEQNSKLLPEVPDIYTGGTCEVLDQTWIYHFFGSGIGPENQVIRLNLDLNEKWECL